MVGVGMVRTLKVIGIGGIALMLAGCATGMKGSGRRACFDAGLTPGTPEFSECWKRIARRDNAEAFSGVVNATAAYGIMQSAAAPATGISSGWQRHTLVAESFAVTGDKLCRYDNGTVLNMGSGTCPAYVGGR